MHVPYILKIFKDAGREDDLRILPLYIGFLKSEDLYRSYADVLLPLFQDDRTVFVISSDFCHWGKCFNFTSQFEDEPIIHRSIKKLDRMAFDRIETHNFTEFVNY